MKRYLLFGGDNYYPSGGWYDFIDSFDTAAEAQAAAEQEHRTEWWHVIDGTTGKTVVELGSLSPANLHRKKGNQ